MAADRITFSLAPLVFSCTGDTLSNWNSPLQRSSQTLFEIFGEAPYYLSQLPLRPQLPVVLQHSESFGERHFKEDVMDVVEGCTEL